MTGVKSKTMSHTHTVMVYRLSEYHLELITMMQSKFELHCNWQNAFADLSEKTPKQLINAYRKLMIPSFDCHVIKNAEQTQFHFDVYTVNCGVVKNAQNTHTHTYTKRRLIKHEIRYNINFVWFALSKKQLIKQRAAKTA